jgi:hypothetical protein
MRRLVLALWVISVGCDTPQSPPSRAPEPEAASRTYSVYEVKTPAALEMYLDVRSCEGWHVQEILRDEERFTVVLWRDTPMPTQECPQRAAQE